MRNVLRSCLPVLAMAAPLAAADDVIIMNSGQRLIGTIDVAESAKTNHLVVIKTDKGVMRIREDLIKESDESYETRRARLSDNDYAGLVALAKYCIQKKDYAHAKEALMAAIKLIDAQADAWKLLAELYDVGSDPKGPEAALPYYQMYKKKGGSDAATLARLKQLEDIKAAYESGETTTTESNKVATSNDGLESRGWDNESTQWSNPIETKIVNVDNNGENNRILQIKYTGGDKDKAAVKKSVRLSIDKNCVLTLWVSNPSEKQVELALAVKTGNHVFHESSRLVIPPGEEWRQVRYNLRGNDFKSESTNWKNTGSVTNLNDVKELQFLIYNHEQSGTLLLDGIDFLAPKEL